jgi:hypothetical protein
MTARTDSLARTNRAAFTRYTERDEQYGRRGQVTCSGANHSDVLEHGTCDACGASVTRTHRGSIVEQGRYCFANAHLCDPAMVEMRANETAAKVESGEVVKGATVVVARGRKVAKGTTGIVRWLGEDSYGKARAGLAVEGTQGLVYTAASNLDVVTTEPVAVPATALLEVSAYETRLRADYTQVLGVDKAHADMVALVGEALTTVEQTPVQRAITLDMLEGALQGMRDNAERVAEARAWLAAHPA